MSYAAWLITSWIRAKHGYPIEHEWGGMTEKSESSDAGRQIELLSNENAGLKAQVSRLAERVAVLDDRKSVVLGKSVAVRFGIGGRLLIKQKFLFKSS